MVFSPPPTFIQLFFLHKSCVFLKKKKQKIIHLHNWLKNLIFNLIFTYLFDFMNYQLDCNYISLDN